MGGLIRLLTSALTASLYRRIAHLLKPPGVLIKGVTTFLKPGGYGENEYELIDTPGLCEGGEELDSLYLGLADQFLLDERVCPNLVFKSDDSRLRSEDYLLINTLLKRYGNRIFINSALMLTFAGNLPSDYHSVIHKRVRLITTAIYGIQTSLGMEIFHGFPRITLVDSELKSFFDIDLPRNNITADILNAAIERKHYEEVAKKLDVHPEVSEGILISITSATVRESLARDDILDAINRFPFHNLPQNSSSNLESTICTENRMTEEPKSVYELAQLLSAEGYDERSISIENGFLTFKRTVPYRKLVDSERYADCISVAAYAERDSQENLLTYGVHYKISNHHYKENGELDIDAIFRSADEASSTIFFKPDKYQDFKRLIGHPEYILNTGLIAFRKAVDEALVNENLWSQEST